MPLDVSGYTYDSANNNNAVMNLDAEVSTDGIVTVAAKVTVGNLAGPEPSSTGGSGLYPLFAVGAAPFAASLASLALERRRA